MCAGKHRAYVPIPEHFTVYFIFFTEQSKVTFKHSSFYCSAAMWWIILHAVLFLSCELTPMKTRYLALYMGLSCTGQSCQHSPNTCGVNKPLYMRLCVRVCDWLCAWDCVRVTDCVHVNLLQKNRWNLNSYSGGIPSLRFDEYYCDYKNELMEVTDWYFMLNPE